MSQASTPFANGRDYFLGNASVVKLRGGQWISVNTEGIVNVEDLLEFEDDDIDNVVLNLRRPQDVWHPTEEAVLAKAEIPADLNAVPPVLFIAAVLPCARVDAWTEKQPPYVCSALSVKKLKLAADLVRYYTGTGRPLTVENMTYVILKDYNDHLKSVKALKKDQDIKLMLFRKNTVTLRWFEAATTFLSAYIGARNCPLAYVTRELAVPDPHRPALLIDKCYSDEHDSIKNELVAFLCHDHTLYKDDNAKVYELLEEALRGSTMDPTIQPYKRRKDGRRAWIALNEQHAGKDKWITELAKEEVLLKQRIYTGKPQSRHTLEMHCDCHRQSNLRMISASEHVSYQLPNQSTRVRYLLDTIKCTDSLLMARIANIQCDQDALGKLHDFEKAVAFLLPACPLARRLATAGEIVEHKTAGISSMTLKEGVGSTGVEFRWYPRKEFAALTGDQKDELREFTNSTAGKKQKEASARSKGKGGGRPAKKQKTNNDANTAPVMSERSVKKIAAAVVKAGKQKDKETSMYDQGMQTISALLGNSATPAQVGGVGGDVSGSGGFDERGEKMAAVATVLKSFMRKSKRGNGSKKNNGDSDKE